MDFEALERLGRLRDSGAITADEFEVEKQRLLGTAPQSVLNPQGDWNSVEPPRNGTRSRVVILLGVLASVSLAGFIAFRVVIPEVSSTDATSQAFDAPIDVAERKSDYRVASSIQGLRIAAAATLPQNPNSNAVDDYCTPLISEPSSPAGKLVQSRGWHVTSEATLGDLKAVSFAGDFEPGTSGTCFAHDGNVAFFADGELVAIAYGESVGTIESLAGEQRARIWSADIRYASAIADVESGAKSVRIVPLSKIDLVCSGSARVPNVFGSSINNARKLLAGSGWRPIPQTDEPDHRTGDLRSAGVVETETCSGTGYGLCEFIYENDSRSTLSVTSAGDDPTVLFYDVECSR